MKTLGRLILVFIPFAYLGALLALIPLEFIVDHSSLDPFNEKGDWRPWVSTCVAIVAFLSGVAGWKLAIIIENMKNKTTRFLARLGLAFVALSLLMGGATIFIAASRGFAHQKRLTKVIASEDMCQALKKGMNEQDVLAIMGPPSIAGLESPMYCSKSADCESVTYDKNRRVVEVGCWDGSSKSFKDDP